MELRILDLVFGRMHDEARRYPIETGGLIVGPDSFTITDLLASGESARRSAGSYELDIEHLQPQLDRAMARGLQFLGVWHVHPEGVPELSHVDRQAARQMLGDRDYNLTRLLLPLTVRTRAGFETRFYCAEGRRPTISLIPSVTVCAPRTHRKAQSSKEPCAQGEVRRGKAIDAALLEVEAAGWHASVREYGSGGAVCAERGGITLWALLPSEFPLSPPDMYVEDSNVKGGLVAVPHQELSETHFWSSERSLAEVFQQADRAVRSEREALAIFGQRGLKKVVGAMRRNIRR